MAKESSVGLDICATAERTLEFGSELVVKANVCNHCRLHYVMFS